MRSTLAEAALRRGEAPVWLLTLTLSDGRVLRAASRSIDVPAGQAGRGPYQYHGTLSGLDELVEELDLLGLDGVGALTQAKVELVVTEDLAAMMEDWHHLLASRVDLSLLWEGETFLVRQVALAGTLTSLEFGLEGAVVSLGLESLPPATSAVVGDDTRDLGVDYELASDTDTTAMTDLSGAKYQRVYGDPESVPGYKVGSLDGSNNALILAGHEFARTGVGYEVIVYNDGASIGTFEVSNGTSASGDIAYVEAPDADDHFKSPDNTGPSPVCGAYTYSAVHGGIAASDNVSAAALQAAGVLSKLLTESGVDVDWPAMQPALVKLRSWRVGLIVDQQAPALDLVRDRLLPFLPLVEMTGSAGLWYAWADPADLPLSGTLIVGQHLLGRVGPMTVTDPDALRNAFTMRYWRDARTGEYTRTITLNADSDALCALSQQLYGVRADDTIDCDVFWDEATPQMSLKARASRLALPRRVQAYLAAPDLYWLRAGQCWRIIDADYSIDSRAIITRFNRAMTPPAVTVEFLDRTPVTR